MTSDQRVKLSRRRHWPDEDTEWLLNYIEKHGATLETKGPQRTEGYERLAKRLNKASQASSYSVDDISEHCNNIIKEHAHVQGPNLKSFFREGKEYLQPPLGTAAPILRIRDKDASDSADLNETTLPLRLSNKPSGRWNLRPRPEGDRRVDASSRSKISTSKGVKRQRVSEQDLKRHKEPEENLKNQPEGSVTDHDVVFETIQQWSNPPSKRTKLYDENIPQRMIQLSRRIRKVVIAYLNEEGVILLPLSEFEGADKHCEGLTELMNRAMGKQFSGMCKLNGSKRRDFLRGLVGRSVLDWVFEDPFPAFGTEDGPLWDTVTRLLHEWGQYTLPHLSRLGF